MAIFVSYAQNFEDVMLWRALGGVGHGRYIDLGAADPAIQSVTRAFYERGWRGINVEPHPGLFARLAAARTEDINLNCAVGQAEGVRDLFLIGRDDRLSTTAPAVAEAHAGQGHAGLGGAGRQVRIPVRTLAQLCALYAASPIHFLKIDTEGAEAAVLQGADFTQWRPWIILIEALHPVSLAPTHAEWEGMLRGAGYHFVYFDGLNRFYVADEQARLDVHFQAPPNPRDAFLRGTDALLPMVREIEDGHRQISQGLHATIHDLTAERDRLAAELRRLGEERDAWAQELFETNRHAAQRTQEYQTLLDASHTLEEDRRRMETELSRVATHAAAEKQLREAELSLAATHAAAEKRLLEAELSRLRGQVAALYDSTSWKFARPVRALGKLLGRR